MLDDEWRVFLHRVRGCSPGQCDHCQVARISLLAGGSSRHLATDAEALTWLRKVEVIALGLLREPTVRGAIRRVAARLCEVGDIGGDEVAAIVAGTVEVAEIENWKRRLTDENC
ncbi:MAG: hypothetical protein K2X45_13870 [Phreatobacter sp.]|nr:hypothetical protein [Phreatobacter sp.]